MWNPADPIIVTPEQKKTLELWVRSPSTPQGVVLRASIIILASKGMANNAIASGLSSSRPTVLLWRERFGKGGTEALREIKEGRGRKAVITGKRVEKIVDDTLHRKPLNATHWSTRGMAEEQGVSHTFIQRVWEAHGLRPHLVKTFKLSNDKNFNEKLKDVVGLYMNPPENALVFSVDEKSQIQALDRTQPSLPLKSGQAGTVTHDYKRNGTTTLFAALNVLKGEVIGQCMKRHRHQEYLRFLKLIDRQTPGDLDIHIIADNYRTHKTDQVKIWLERHPRFHCHFTPTSSSWLNLVERWFREITDKRIRRGAFESVASLEEAIYDYIEKNNENPKPFVWTKKAEDIIEKVNRCKVVLKTLH